MARTISILGAAAATAASLALTACPGFGADTGTISAKVSVAAPCISISFIGSTTSLDFGTNAFSTTTGNAGSGMTNLSLTNCGTGSESIAARTTKATNTPSTGGLSQAVVWDPVKSSSWGAGTICSAGVNRYVVGVERSAIAGPLDLTETNALFYAASAGNQQFVHTFLVMPCSGSDGGGAEMNFQLIFTASL